MTDITLTISKSSVYDEVARTTAYVGQKAVDDEGAYERIFTLESDQKQLDRFWDECQTEVCERFKKYVTGEEEDDGAYKLGLSLSSSFDATLKEAMGKDLFSFFVMGIAAKWFAFTNKGDAGSYADEAERMLTNLHKKAVFKKRPIRPTYAEPSEETAATEE